MRDLRLEMVVGAFLVLGVACLTWLALRMGDVRISGADTYALHARFVSVSGLKRGAQVELAGVRVGRVADIRLDGDSYEAVIELAVDSGVSVSEDAIASIRTQGIIGDKFVKITPGGSPGALAPGGEILETESSISLEELISKYIFESGR